MKREMIYFERPVALGMNFFGGWDKLAEKIRSGESGLEVGDIFPLTLKSDRDIELVVVGVDIYNKGEVIFSFKNIFAERLINDTCMDWVLESIFAKLPDDLAHAIKPRNGEKLWLFSRTEVIGEPGRFIVPEDDKPLPYFKSLKNRIMFVRNEPQGWWLSSRTKNLGYRGYINRYGSCNLWGNDADDLFGVVPGFMI